MIAGDPYRDPPPPRLEPLPPLWRLALGALLESVGHRLARAGRRLVGERYP